MEPISIDCITLGWLELQRIRNKEVKPTQYLTNIWKTNFDGLLFLMMAYISENILLCYASHAVLQTTEGCVTMCYVSRATEGCVTSHDDESWLISCSAISQAESTYSSQILYKFWDGNAMLSAKWSISPGDILPPKQYLCPCSNICFHNLKYICLFHNLKYIFFHNLKYIFLSHYSWKWSLWIHRKQGCVYLCWVPFILNLQSFKLIEDAHVGWGLSQKSLGPKYFHRFSRWIIQFWWQFLFY